MEQGGGGWRSLSGTPAAGREGLFRALSAGLIMPVQVAMLPLFLLFKQLGLINTYWGVIVPSLASIFGIFLIRQYTQSIPDDLLDAARIDGASELRIYWSVVLPVIRPILATLSIWTFLTTWNDFMWPLIVLSDSSRYTLPVALANLAGEHVQDTELMMAGSVITVLPVMLTFLVLQRYYLEGVTAGSVKG
jgi:multiple sugar transport system permease protein